MVRVVFLANNTIYEDVRVEDDSNNHRNNTSFSLRQESVGLVNNGDDSRWDDMFKLLLEFKQKHGHLMIPCDCGNENKKLGIWVKEQRSNYREYKRTNGQKGDPERMKCLESIGLVDDITATVHLKRRYDKIWYDMYNQLLEFRQKHGHVKVPHQYNENKKLGMWVGHWRRNYREHKRTNGQIGDPERMKRLESIGLVDDITTGYEKVKNNKIWYDMYNQLLEFKQKHGHAKVPQRYNENKKLGMWVNKWRCEYREYKRTNRQKGDPERMKCLESIGMVDDITTGYAKVDAKENWYGMYNQLLEFKQKYGHVAVPKQYNENPKLGKWVVTWKKAYRVYKKTNRKKGDPERMKRLESIGLVDSITTGYAKESVKEDWYVMFSQLLEFKQKHGHVKVPQQYNENPKLGMWVKNWRSNYIEYKRTDGEKGDPERMKCLESIGLVDDITATVYAKESVKEDWYVMFSQLLEFRQKHGHVKVPQRYNENEKLGNWVNLWRCNYREYKRTDRKKGDPERMKCLESIGLVDDIIATGYEKESVKENWYVMFSQLLEFKQKHGHMKVPSKYNENKKLGMWVVTCRRNYRKYKRTNGKKGDPERMKCLESIGLVDDITTGYETKGVVKEHWYDMYSQLLEFKQKHGHVKVPQQYNENPKLGMWVGHWRRNYRVYKRTNGEKGDPVLMKHLESIGLVDDIRIRIHHDKMINCANGKVSAPIIASSTSSTSSSHTQTITTKEIPLLAGMKGEEKNDDNSGGVNDTQAHLDFLGSELRGKGGFWV
jgi:hypothetical protein